MTQVRVFNPADTPVYIDNGKVIPGSDWATVESTLLVEGLIASGVLIRKSPPDEPLPPQLPETDPEPVAEEEPEPTVADEESPSTDVSSEEETTKVIDTDNQPKPASMKRRRKSPSPTKE